MQDFFAILIVLTAVAYLGRVTWLSVVGRKQGACGSCQGCGVAKPATEVPLLQLDTPLQRD